MKRDLLTRNIILVLSLVFITLNIGCSGKLKDAAEHYDIAVIHWGQGRVDDAIEEYKKAISIYPGFEIAHFNLGYVYYQKGDIGLAIESFKRAIESKPDLIEAH
ncbi:MAG: tetratricopeptide repeat protein, partial [Candidatus Scalindua sediminis]